MKWLILFLAFCRPGIIWEYDGTSTDIVGEPGVYETYELEYTPGAYLYISETRDTVWFYVEDKAYYLSDSSKEFQIQN